MGQKRINTVQRANHKRLQKKLQTILDKIVSIRDELEHKIGNDAVNLDDCLGNAETEIKEAKDCYTRYI